MTKLTLTARKELAAQRLGIIAPLAFKGAITRSTVVEAIKLAVGNAPRGYNYAKPKPAHKTFTATLALARAEFVAGWLAGLLPEFGNMPEADAIAATRTVIANAAVDAKKIKASQTGRRSPAQERAYATARQYASEVLKAAGYAPAAPSKTPKGGKRAPHQNNGGPNAQTDAQEALDADKLTKTAMTKEIALAHIDTQAASLLGFVKKHAGKVPTNVAEAVHAFRSAMLAATAA